MGNNNPINNQFSIRPSSVAYRVQPFSTHVVIYVRQVNILCALFAIIYVGIQHIFHTWCYATIEFLTIQIDMQVL